MKKKTLKKLKHEKCEICGVLAADVRYQPNSYAQDVGNDPDAYHTVCDECAYQNAMDI